MLKVSSGEQVVGEFGELRVEFEDRKEGRYVLELMLRSDRGERYLDINFTYPGGSVSNWESIRLVRDDD